MPRSFLLPLAGLLLPLALASHSPLGAQTAAQVADLTVSSPSSGGPGSVPLGLVSFRGKVLFSATAPGSGRELWISDGADKGTRQLADFCLGDCDSNPVVLGATSTVAFGTADIGRPFGTVKVLWRSDGTARGTYLLASAGAQLLLPDPEDIPFAYTAVLGNVFYFAGCANGERCGLWRSDGSVAGTRVVQEVGGNYPRLDLAVAGNRLYFASFAALWVTDGTEAGTRLLKSSESFAVRRITALGSKLYFLCSDSIRGEELWVSDGTAAGTRPVTDISYPSPFDQTLFLKALGGKLYFVVNDVVHEAELWVSDGTQAGTRAVTDFGFHDPFNVGDDRFDETGLLATDLELVGNRVVFWATDGIHGFQPWSTTGTPASTTPLCPSCMFSNARAALVKVGSRLVFAARDGAHGNEAWSTDGTVPGTVRLADVCPGPCEGIRSSPLPLLGVAVLSATATTDARNLSLWVSDGTVTGTRRFANPGAYLDYGYGVGPQLAAVGATLYYSANGTSEAYGIELWSSDGTPAGTRPVTDIARDNGSTEFASFAAAGRDLFFATCGTSQPGRTWFTRGTPGTTSGVEMSICGSYAVRTAVVSGTLVFPRNDYFEDRDQLWRRSSDGALLELTQFETKTNILDLASLGDRLVFAVQIRLDGEAYRTEIWRSDGTVQGTVKAAELPSNVVGPYFFTIVGAEVWFSANDRNQNGGSLIWRSDGTAAGTSPVADFGGGRTVFDPEFTRIGSTVYFVGADTQDQRQLWKSDGTPAGSAMVKDLDPTPNDPYSDAVPADLTAYQGMLYFSARTPAGRSGLWRSDGTAAGTVLVRDFVDPGSFEDDYADQYWPSPLDLQVAGSWLVFAANDGNGRELWRSDGTLPGTTLLRELTLTDELDLSVTDAFFHPAAGRLFFRASDGVHGYELWQTDGTPGGTRLVQDLAPFAASSDPADLTVAGDRLFFTATEGVTGRELWVLPLTGSGCAPSDSALCLAGGRFEVKVSWRDFAGNTGAGHAVPISGDTGTFWFFDPANVETVVKVLDGIGVNGHFWVFFGALSNVEYTLTVTDTRTGAARRYFNPRGIFASVGDTEGFGPLGATAAEIVAAAGPSPRIEEKATAAAGACVPAPGRLCLNGGRFAVEATWKDFSDRTGTGKAVSLTGDTGYFWFFDAANVETVIKVLDGTGLNGHFWVFCGALSNVEYTLKVTDTLSGKTKTYNNPKGRFASFGDTVAF